jgi:hypothetical protein
LPARRRSTGVGRGLGDSRDRRPKSGTVDRRAGVAGQQVVVLPAAVRMSLGRAVEHDPRSRDRSNVDDAHRLIKGLTKASERDRVLDRAGYARFRHRRVYAERGLNGEPAAVWLYAEPLTLVSRDEPLAQHRVAHEPDKRRLRSVTTEHLFATAHRSPRLPF